MTLAFATGPLPLWVLMMADSIAWFLFLVGVQAIWNVGLRNKWIRPALAPSGRPVTGQSVAVWLVFWAGAGIWLFAFLNGGPTERFNTVMAPIVGAAFTVSLFLRFRDTLRSTRG